MAIDPIQLQAHLDDHRRVTRRGTDRFVCPITLRECEPDELSNGHIINSRILGVSNRTVIQYREIDNFYGTRVEEDFVHFLNLGMSGKRADMMRRAKGITLEFAEGSPVDAFVGGRDASVRYPAIDLVRDDETFALFVKTSKDDPRLLSPDVLVSVVHSFSSSLWVGAMVKCGYLALFEMLGYRSVYEPYSDTIRRDLKAYFVDGASRKEAGVYFARYRNAAKVIAQRGESGFEPLPWDTLDNRVVMMHSTRSGTMFAVTCIFRTLKASIAVTLPQSIEGSDPATVVEYYDRLMNNEKDLPQEVRLAEFTGTEWHVLKAPKNVGYVDDLTKLVD